MSRWRSRNIHGSDVLWITLWCLNPDVSLPQTSVCRFQVPRVQSHRLHPTSGGRSSNAPFSTSYSDATYQTRVALPLVKEHMMTEAAGRRAVCSTSGVQTKLLSSFMPESVRASYSETIWAQEASFTLNSPESLVPLQLFFCCLNNGWAPHSWAWTHGRNVPTRPRMLHHAVYIIICHAEFQTCDCLQMTTHAHYWLIHLPMLGPVLLFTCMLLFP